MLPTSREGFGVELAGRRLIVTARPRFVGKASIEWSARSLRVRARDAKTFALQSQLARDVLEDLSTWQAASLNTLSKVLPEGATFALLRSRLVVKFQVDEPADVLAEVLDAMIGVARGFAPKKSTVITRLTNGLKKRMPVEVRRREITELAAFRDDPLAAKALRRALDDETDTDTRFHLASVLGRDGAYVLYALAKDGRVPIALRLRAVSAFAAVAEADALCACVEEVGIGGPLELCAAAIQELPQDARAIAALSSIARAPEDDRALLAVRRLRDLGALASVLETYLIERLSRTGHDELRLAIIETLGICGAAASLRTLTALPQPLLFGASYKQRLRAAIAGLQERMRGLESGALSMSEDTAGAVSVDRKRQ